MFIFYHAAKGNTNPFILPPPKIKARIGFEAKKKKTLPDTGLLGESFLYFQVRLFPGTDFHLLAEKESLSIKASQRAAEDNIKRRGRNELFQVIEPVKNEPADFRGRNRPVFCIRPGDFHHLDLVFLQHGG